MTGWLMMAGAVWVSAIIVVLSLAKAASRQPPEGDR